MRASSYSDLSHFECSNYETLSLRLDWSVDRYRRIGNGIGDRPTGRWVADCDLEIFVTFETVVAGNVDGQIDKRLPSRNGDDTGFQSTTDKVGAVNRKRLNVVVKFWTDCLDRVIHLNGRGATADSRYTESERRCTG